MEGSGASLMITQQRRKHSLNAVELGIGSLLFGERKKAEIAGDQEMTSDFLR